MKKKIYKIYNLENGCLAVYKEWNSPLNNKTQFRNVENILSLIYKDSFKDVFLFIVYCIFVDSFKRVVLFTVYCTCWNVANIMLSSGVIIELRDIDGGPTTCSILYQRLIIRLVNLSFCILINWKFWGERIEMCIYR